jgi:hypothetical protein
MNIQQLKDTIAANANILKAYYPPDAGMTDQKDYFFIKLYEKTGTDTADDRSYCVVVKDRDKPTEQVFFKNGLPQSMQSASTAFRTKVETGIITYQAAHPELKWYEINSVDEIKKVARVTGYELVTGLLVPKQYLLYADSAGNLQRYTIQV